MRRRSLLAGAGAALAAPRAVAAPFPSAPIRVVIPFEPGGPSDVMVRAIAPVVTRRLGGGIVVDNRSGAGGNIASALVARAEPDGHTLLAGGSPTVISPHFIPGLGFDVGRDLVAVAPLSLSPYYVVVNDALPARTVAELVEMARRAPGAVTYASSGIGNRPHVAGAQFAVLTGTRMTHVPYRGTAPATNDLLAGRVTFLFTGMATVRGHVQAGKLRVLAVCTPERDPDFPDVPTLAEAGVPDYFPNVWYGLMAPAGTGAETRRTIADAVGAALRDPEVARQYATLGAAPMLMGVDAFQAFYDAEVRRWDAFFRDNPDILKEPS